MSSFSIGVDLGGSNLRVGAFTAEVEPLEFSTRPARVAAGPEAVASDVCGEVRRLLHNHSRGRTFQGIGVGAPGPLEWPQGRLMAPPNLPGFAGFPLRRTLEDMLQMPVSVEHDANAAALAECRLGAGKAHRENSLCMLTLGTGVGAGIVLNGRIWRGSNGFAGEAGHVPLFPDGLACPCGGRGCLELYASATGIRRMAAERAAAGTAPYLRHALEKDASGVVEIANLADGGDRTAIEIFREMGRCLAIGLAGLVNLLNLPLYAIGGGVANAWHLFAPAMFETLAGVSYVYRPTRPGANRERSSTRVVPSLLGADAGLLGAAMLPYFEPLPGRAIDPSAGPAALQFIEPIE